MSLNMVLARLAGAQISEAPIDGKLEKLALFTGAQLQDYDDRLCRPAIERLEAAAAIIQQLLDHEGAERFSEGLRERAQEWLEDCP